MQPRYFFEHKVADYMEKNVVSLAPDRSLHEAGNLFDQFDFNSIPVLENGILIGIISKFDFMRAFAFTEQHPLPDYAALMTRPIREYMREELVTTTPETPLTRVLQRMVELRTRSFPVVDGGKLVGIISREDIIRALKESSSNLQN